MRELKFRVIYKGKISGYERLKDGNWEWMSFDTNGNNKENWYRSVFPHNDRDSFRYQRDQYTSLKDWYEGDILKDDFTGIVSIIRFGFSKKIGTIGFYLENRKHPFLHYPLDNEMEGYQKLGNIYSNPELLQP